MTVNNSYMFNMTGFPGLQGFNVTQPDSLGLFSSGGLGNIGGMGAFPLDSGGVDSFCRTMLVNQQKMQQEFITALLSVLSNMKIDHKPESFVKENFRPYDYGKYSNNGDKISQLEPKMQEKTMQLLDYAKSQGMNVTITSGYRNREEQDALCKKTHLAVKNSPHIQGKAVDLSIEGDKDEDYKKLGDYAKSIGMRWGGDFKHPEAEGWHFDYGWR